MLKHSKSQAHTGEGFTLVERLSGGFLFLFCSGKGGAERSFASIRFSECSIAGGGGIGVGWLVGIVGCLVG